LLQTGAFVIDQCIAFKAYVWYVAQAMAKIDPGGIECAFYREGVRAAGKASARGQYVADRKNFTQQAGLL